MELMIGTLLAILGIISGLYIAVRQGVFHKNKVLLTLSQPTLSKKSERVPTFVEIPKIGNLKYPESYPDAGYPFLLEMPLLVIFGLADVRKKNILILPITILNREAKSVDGMVLDISFPSELVPDQDFEIGVPSGLRTERTFDEAIETGHVRYELDLKPHDCEMIAEPILIDAAQVIKIAQGERMTIHDNDPRIFTVRCVIRMEDVIEETVFQVAAVESDSIEDTCDKAIELGSSIVDDYLTRFKKPLIHRMLRLPYGRRALMCVRPEMTVHDPDFASHAFGTKGDTTESTILGVVIR